MAVDLRKQIGLTFHLPNQFEILVDEVLDVIGVVFMWMAISEATASERLAAISSAAACTPAIIDKNKFSRM